MDSIVIASTSYDLSITRKNISGIKLKLKSQTELEIICHALTPVFIIKKFLLDNKDWIIKNSQKIKPKILISALSQISILGDIYLIHRQKASKDTVLIDVKNKILNINSSDFSENNTKNILEKRFRRFALSLIKEELEILSEKYGFKYGRVSVKKQSTRFGSCSSLGNLNFNWQIIFFPKDKFRHILLHELNHLKIKNHQSEFWHQLSQYDPEFFHNNRWLKKTGSSLLIFN